MQEIKLPEDGCLRLDHPGGSWVILRGKWFVQKCNKQMQHAIVTLLQASLSQEDDSGCAMSLQIVSDESCVCIRLPSGSEIDALIEQDCAKWIDRRGRRNEIEEAQIQRALHLSTPTGASAARRQHPLSSSEAEEENKLLRLKFCLDLCGIRSRTITMDIDYRRDNGYEGNPFMHLEQGVSDDRPMPTTLLDIAFYLDRMYPDKVMHSENAQNT